jgi:hypothetical protein
MEEKKQTKHILLEKFISHRPSGTVMPDHAHSKQIIECLTGCCAAYINLKKFTERGK